MYGNKLWQIESPASIVAGAVGIMDIEDEKRMQEPTTTPEKKFDLVIGQIGKEPLITRITRECLSIVTKEGLKLKSFEIFIRGDESSKKRELERITSLVRVIAICKMFPDLTDSSRRLYEELVFSDLTYINTK